MGDHRKHPAICGDVRDVAPFTSRAASRRVPDRRGYLRGQLRCAGVDLDGLALHADHLEPATARTVLDVAVFWGPVLTGATTTMIAPVTLLALRRQAKLPWWLGVLGAVAFAEQAIETITIFGSVGFTEPGGPMNLQLGAGLTAAWMLAFAVWGGLRGRRENTIL